MIVNGDNVTAYRLFVEHYEKYEVIWNANDGTDIFFENETSYNAPSQAAWMEAPGVDGWAAFKVADTVTRFSGYGMGSYSFLTQGVNIFGANAFEVPVATRAGAPHDLLTVFLNGSGGILNWFRQLCRALSETLHFSSWVESTSAKPLNYDDQG